MKFADSDQPLSTSKESSDLCFEAAKLLPYQPDWLWLRRLCDQLTVDGQLPTAEALAEAYRNRSALWSGSR